MPVQCILIKQALSRGNVQSVVKKWSQRNEKAILKLKPYSAFLLGLVGLIIAAIGIYFIFLLPSLLAEDLHYVNTTIQDVQNSHPGLLRWLQKVFWDTTNSQHIYKT